MIIGLTGKKRSGKDTIADYLVEKFNFQKMGFATIMKQAVANLLVITPQEVDNWKEDDVYVEVYSTGLLRHLTWRQFLQRFGTEMGRNTFGENFWVDQFWKNTPEGNLVIPDCRFDNEAHSIRIRGGFIFRVERPGTDDTDMHPSEQGDFKVDGTINNDRTKGHLYEKATNLVEALSIDNYV